MNKQSMLPSKENQIVIERSIDLLKIPYSVMNSAKLTNFSGTYFDKIYQEALKIEQGENSLSLKTGGGHCRKKCLIDTVSFEIVFPTNFGEEVGMLGSIDQLGNWRDSNIMYLSWGKGNIWSGSFPLTNVNEFEYKFILTDKRKIKKWESGPNRKFNIVTMQGDVEKQVKCDDYEYDDNKKMIKLKCKWN